MIRTREASQVSKNPSTMEAQSIHFLKKMKTKIKKKFKGKMKMKTKMKMIFFFALYFFCFSLCKVKSVLHRTFWASVLYCNRHFCNIPCTFPHSMAGWWRFPGVLHCHDGKADCQDVVYIFSVRISLSHERF